MEKISEVRKSGLTFAVETPVDAWQMMINKNVSLDSIAEILINAKKRGWRGAKFYFMIGLPVFLPKNTREIGEREPISEEKEIVGFITELARRTKMVFNVNVSAFIPKPHTPFQWAAQLSEAAAGEKISYIREKLRPLGHKTGAQDPFVSVIEGVISRGDERAGAEIASPLANRYRRFKRDSIS